MSLKVLGSILIVLSCGGFGLITVLNHKREEAALRQLINALDFMECELQYRLTPLPGLCAEAGQQGRGITYSVLKELSQEMESQISPDVPSCMHAALAKHRDLPPITKTCLVELGKTLGRFDLTGQLRGLETVRKECRARLEGLEKNRDVRLRSYQTLWLCAGAALAILLI